MESQAIDMVHDRARVHRERDGDEDDIGQVKEEGEGKLE